MLDVAVPVVGVKLRSPGLGVLVERLPVSSIRLQFQALQPWSLPRFPGSIVSSAVGAALVGLSCSPLGCSGPPCKTSGICRYRELFESPPPSTGVGTASTDTAPHPFALSASIVEESTRLAIVIDLFGAKAVALGSDVVQATIQSVESGLSRNRIQGRLQSIEHRDAIAGTWQSANASLVARPAVFEPFRGRAVRLRFISPLRVISRGKLTRPGGLSPGVLVRSLMRRASLLIAHYGEAGANPDFQVFAQLCDPMRWADAKLTWYEQQRFSARQGALVPAGGILGEATLSGPFLAGIWPLLKLGERIRVGKGTLGGQGVIEVDQQ